MAEVQSRKSIEQGNYGVVYVDNPGSAQHGQVMLYDDDNTENMEQAILYPRFIGQDLWVYVPMNCLFEPTEEEETAFRLAYLTPSD